MGKQCWIKKEFMNKSLAGEWNIHFTNSTNDEKIYLSDHSRGIELKIMDKGSTLGHEYFTSKSKAIKSAKAYMKKHRC